MKRNVKSRVFAIVIGLLFLAGCAAFVSNIVFGGKGIIGELLASWWTLFLIIPGFMGLFQRGTRLSGLWLLIVGVGLLVRSQGWFDHILADVTWWQMGLAALLFVIGLGIIGAALGIGKKHRPTVAGNCGNITGSWPVEGCTGAAGSGRGTYSSANGRNAEAVFSEQNVSFSEGDYEGGELTAVFGTLVADLRSAVIPHDCTIKASSVFGTVRIYRSPAVSYRITRNTIFGEVKADNIAEVEGAPIVNIVANAVFGTVELI